MAFLVVASALLDFLSWLLCLVLVSLLCLVFFGVSWFLCLAAWKRLGLLVSYITLALSLLLVELQGLANLGVCTWASSWKRLVVGDRLDELQGFANPWI